MRTLLVIPPYRTADALVADLYPMPLGAVILGTILKERGHSVVVKDFLVPAQKYKTPRPASFKGRGGPPYLHYGQLMDDCKQWLVDNHERFDAVGLFLGQCNIYETGFELGWFIKHNLEMPLVVGGPFATTAPDVVMANTEADILVRGEGELVVVDAFTKAIARHKAGIGGAVMEGMPVYNMDLDIPVPDWSLAPPSNYPKVNGKVRGVLAVSRGCPHACRFCSVHTVHGKRHVRMSRARMLTEILNLRQYNVQRFCFLDDNLFINTDAVKQVCEAVVNARNVMKRGVTFYNEEGLEVKVASTPGMVQNIVKAGFTDIALGVESLNAGNLEAMRKPYVKTQLKAAVKEFERAGVKAKALYIIGFPDDSLESVCQNLIEFSGFGLLARPNNLKLYPGTEITKEFISRGWIKPNYDWRLSSFYTPPTGMLMDFVTLKKLKTYLRALGKAAEMGIKPFTDGKVDIVMRLQAKGYGVRFFDDGSISIVGNTFRATHIRYLAEFFILRFVACGGAKSEMRTGEVVAWAVKESKDHVQAAFIKALKEVRNG